MNKLERVLLWTTLPVCLALAAGLRPWQTAEAQPASGGTRIATIDILQVTEKLTQSEKYKPARDAKMAELQQPIDTLRAAVAEVEKKITAIPDWQNNPEAKPLITDHQQKRAAFDSVVRDARVAAEQFNVAQVREAYRLTCETAERLAKQRGYTHVVASRGAEAGFAAQQVEALIREVLGRPIVMGPASDDLTKAVEEELKVQDVVVLGPDGQPLTPPKAAQPTDGNPAQEKAAPATESNAK